MPPHVPPPRGPAAVAGELVTGRHASSARPFHITTACRARGLGCSCGRQALGWPARDLSGPTGLFLSLEIRIACC